MFFLLWWSPHFVFNPPPMLLFSFPQKPKSKAQKAPTTFVFVIIINLYSLKSLTMKKRIQAQVQNPPHCERNRPLKYTPIPLPLSPNPNQRKLLSSSQSQTLVSTMSAIGINLNNNSALQSAASFLRRSTTRRIREPSLRAHTRAAQSPDGGRVIIMDVLWNLMFVAAAAVALMVSSGELPKLPLRMWVVGYVIQCVMQVVCVCVEHWERRRRGMSFFREVRLREFHREVNWREEEGKR